MRRWPESGCGKSLAPTFPKEAANVECSHLTLLYCHLLSLCSSSLLSQLEVHVWFKYSFDKACIFLIEIRISSVNF